MRQIEATAKRVIGGAALAVAFTVAGPTVAFAQETTTTETATEETVTTSATPEMICEAKQRGDARYKKWLEEGIPEEFGSEEPFTFDPSKC